MSSPESARPSSDAHTPVFVDDSGRRRARLRIGVRVVVGVLGLYVVAAVVSLVAPVSFPIAHLGNLGVLPRHRQNATLGPLSKVAALPPALAGSGQGSDNTSGSGNGPSATTATPSRTTTPNTNPSGAVAPPTRSTTLPAATTIPAGATTTTPRAGTTTSTLAPTTTSAHGPPTTGTHGPPTTTPGKGSKP